jgi:hypothetical protein
VKVRAWADSARTTEKGCAGRTVDGVGSWGGSEGGRWSVFAGQLRLQVWNRPCVSVERCSMRLVCGETSWDPAHGVGKPMTEGAGFTRARASGRVPIGGTSRTAPWRHSLPHQHQHRTPDTAIEDCRIKFHSNHVCVVDIQFVGICLDERKELL